LKKRITITVGEDIFSEFRRFCQINGMKVSSKVERMMIESMRNNHAEASPESFAFGNNLSNAPAKEKKRKKEL
jgi:hypothetical protein